MISHWYYLTRTFFLFFWLVGSFQPVVVTASLSVMSSCLTRQKETTNHWELATVLPSSMKAGVMLRTGRTFLLKVSCSTSLKEPLFFYVFFFISAKALQRPGTRHQVNLKITWNRRFNVWIGLSVNMTFSFFVSTENDWWREIFMSMKLFELKQGRTRALILRKLHGDVRLSSEIIYLKTDWRSFYFCSTILSKTQYFHF